MADIFISYARENLETAKALAQALAGQGWSVWWDRDIPFGKPFDQVIGEALAAARCVIVVWSKHSVTSDWVIEEAQSGRERGILVPMLMDDVAIPFGFRRIQTASLLNWNGDAHAPVFQKLVSDIQGILSTPPKKVERKQDSDRPLPSWIQNIIRKTRHRLIFSLIALCVITSSLGYAVFKLQSARSIISPSPNPDHNPLRQHLDGEYRVNGKNPNGQSYYGNATISHEYGIYYIRWDIGSTPSDGEGELDGTTLTIKQSNSNRIYIYHISENGTLNGEWDNGKGTEILTPYVQNSVK